MSILTANTVTPIYTVPSGKEGAKSVRFVHTGTSTTAVIYLWLVKKGGNSPGTIVQTGDEILFAFPIAPSGINEATIWVSDNDKSTIYAAVSDAAVSVVVHGPENAITP